jgi:5-methylcytosine-specific restriction endonuclease McrA
MTKGQKGKGAAGSSRSIIGAMRPPVNPIQKKDDYRCFYCGKDGLASLDNWHDSVVDHLLPRKYGGTDDADNLITSCHYCNAIKGDQQFASGEDAKAYVQNRRAQLQVIFESVRKAVRG